MRFVRVSFFVIVVLSGFVEGTAPYCHARGLPAQEGINNFAKVDDHLFRGAQPDTQAIKNLQKLGVKTIIDLRLPDEVRKGEATDAQAHGILYTNLPLRGLGRPAKEQAELVLSMVESLPGPVFIHCRFGCDRTGMIVACYRIKHNNMALKNALQEAAKYGMFWFERGMKSYVRDFAQASVLLAKKPAPGTPAIPPIAASVQ